MSITHTVLVAVSSLPTTHLYDGEVADFSIVADFEVDADAEVDPGSRTDDVEICDSTLDDLGEHFAGALVGGHSHARFMSRVQVLSDHGGQFGGRDFVERVSFFLVRVGERNPAGVGLRQRCFDCFIQEVVHSTMLGRAHGTFKRCANARVLLVENAFRHDR